MPAALLTTRNRGLIKLAAGDISAGVEKLKIWAKLEEKLRLDEFPVSDDGAIRVRAKSGEGEQRFEFTDEEFELLTFIVKNAQCWKLSISSEVLALCDRLRVVE